MSEKLRRKFTEFVHDGAYATEVDIEIVYNENWVRAMSADDARKLDTVRLALRAGNIVEAAKHGLVFELTPVAAK